MSAPEFDRPAAVPMFDASVALPPPSYGCTDCGRACGDAHYCAGCGAECECCGEQWARRDLVQLRAGGVLLCPICRAGDDDEEGI